ncbi:hypothetical protein L3V83_13560 [Thiotrichales bacterium 19X7-9]|nr:hypothetical protein [Thiotrichales bacterium 19X7-9]
MIESISDILTTYKDMIIVLVSIFSGGIITYFSSYKLEKRKQKYQAFTEFYFFLLKFLRQHEVYEIREEINHNMDLESPNYPPPDYGRIYVNESDITEFEKNISKAWPFLNKEYLKLIKEIHKEWISELSDGNIEIYNTNLKKLKNYLHRKLHF